ncbi:hypothetical protein EJ07DRAFT_152426 [Lizonia empirigonia]|nr:hypothetical protein EJ07DRAFT_152426 [Lizonia empirigonia]
MWIYYSSERQQDCSSRLLEKIVPWTQSRFHLTSTCSYFLSVVLPALAGSNDDARTLKFIGVQKAGKKSLGERFWSPGLIVKHGLGALRDSYSPEAGPLMFGPTSIGRTTTKTPTPQTACSSNDKFAPDLTAPIAANTNVCPCNGDTFSLATRGNYGSRAGRIANLGTIPRSYPCNARTFRSSPSWNPSKQCDLVLDGKPPVRMALSEIASTTEKLPGAIQRWLWWLHIADGNPLTSSEQA